MATPPEDRAAIMRRMMDEANRLKAVLERQAGRQFDCPRRGCDGRLVFRRAKQRWFWGCSRWPRCKETVEADQTTGEPIEPETDRRTRFARSLLHALIERWCVSSGYSQWHAHQALAARMGITGGEFVVNQFNYAQCQHALGIGREMIQELHRAQMSPAPTDRRARREPQPVVEPTAPKPKVDARVWPTSGTTAAKRRILLDE